MTTRSRSCTRVAPRRDRREQRSTSRSLIAQYVSCIVDGNMTRDDIEIHALPFYHCAQLHCFLTPDIYVGATSIVLPAPDPERSGRDRA